MKKMYLLLLLPALLCSLPAHAVIRNVTVQNFVFTPATMNVNVGDVIKWTWINGSHTTTSLSVPAGAASWDSPMNSGVTTFMYTVTTAGTYNYECTFHSPGMAGSFTATVLPLELVSFTGKTVGSSNWLYWETLTEQNVQWHIVEHSADGEQWTEVGRRPGSANSTVAIKYDLEDQRPFGQTFYRLRSMDFNGKMSFSEVILLGESFHLAKVFPNPTVDRITVQFVSTTAENMCLSIVDLAGKTAWCQVVEAKPGMNTAEVPFGQLPVGAYNLILTDERKVAASLRVLKN